MIKLPDGITYGDKYGSAMKITEQVEADEYFEACVEHMMRFGKTREEAEEIERQNFGYYAGYYDAETQERINKLFKTTHPVFGDKRPTAEEAFKAGRNMVAEK